MWRWSGKHSVELRLLVLLAAALWPLPHAALLAGECRVALAEVEPQRQVGSGCLPAAAAMALAILGTEVAATELARNIPMYRDGASLFDLQEELARRGAASLVFAGTVDDAASAVRAGYPVLLLLDEASGRHTVLTTGVVTGDAAPPCTGPPVALDVVDPRTQALRRLDRDTLAREFSHGHMMLIAPKAEAASSRLLEQGFPVALAHRANARFRAEELVLRAQEHVRPGPQVLLLLERARVEDPCWEVPVKLEAEALTALGRTREALRLQTMTLAAPCAAHEDNEGRNP